MSYLLFGFVVLFAVLFVRERYRVRKLAVVYAQRLDAARECGERNASSEREYFKGLHKGFYEEFLRITDPQHELVLWRLGELHEEIMGDNSIASSGSRGVMVSVSSESLFGDTLADIEFSASVCAKGWGKRSELEDYLLTRSVSHSRRERDATNTIVESDI